MATSSAELVDALRENLSQRGVLDRMRASVYAEVVSALNADDAGTAPPRPPPEALLINDLIREYLQYTGFYQALAVFNLESDAGRTPPQPTGSLLPRSVLAGELGVFTDTAATLEVPLLYQLVSSALVSRAHVATPRGAAVGRTTGAAPTTTNVSNRLDAPALRASAAARRAIDAVDELCDRDVAQSRVPGQEVTAGSSRVQFVDARRGAAATGPGTAGAPGGSLFSATEPVAWGQSGSLVMYGSGPAV